MRLSLVTTVVLVVWSSGVAGHTQCVIPVNIVGSDLSSVSKGEAGALAVAWRKNVEAMKYQLPNGRWDAHGQLSDLLLTVLRERGALATISGGPITLPRPLQIRNLPPSAFIANDKKHPLQIHSATFDRGPRHIILIVENDNRVTPAGRAIEEAVISDLLMKARAEDSFALLTAGGPRLAVGFGSSQEALRAAVNQVATQPQGKWEKRGGVLDAVLEASDWFQPPQPTDSIFVFAMDLGGKHNVSLSKVRAAVITGRIRVFGFELGEGAPPPYLDDLSFEQLATIPQAGFGNVDHFLALSRESGGEAILENTKDSKRYKLSAAHLEGLQGAAETLYNHITECYLLQLEQTSAQTVVGLTLDVLLQHPWVTVSFPQEMPACSGTITETHVKQAGRTPGLSVPTGPTKTWPFP